MTELLTAEGYEQTKAILHDLEHRLADIDKQVEQYRAVGPVTREEQQLLDEIDPLLESLDAVLERAARRSRRRRACR